MILMRSLIFLRRQKAVDVWARGVVSGGGGVVGLWNLLQNTLLKDLLVYTVGRDTVPVDSK